MYHEYFNVVELNGGNGGCELNIRVWLTTSMEPTSFPSYHNPWHTMPNHSLPSDEDSIFSQAS